MTDRERIVEETASRTAAHVVRLLEIQIRELAAAISPTVPAEAALLALADDLRGSLAVGRALH